MKTYKLERLCHQFGVKRRKLQKLATYMSHQCFILLFPDDRYAEDVKLTSGEYKDELFKLIDRVKREESL